MADQNQDPNLIQKAGDFGLEPGLLEKLPQGGRAQRLADLDTAAWKRIDAEEGRTRPPRDEDAPVPDQSERGGDNGAFGIKPALRLRHAARR